MNKCYLINSNIVNYCRSIGLNGFSQHRTLNTLLQEKSRTSRTQTNAKNYDTKAEKLNSYASTRQKAQKPENLFKKIPIQPKINAKEQNLGEELGGKLEKGKSNVSSFEYL